MIEDFSGRNLKGKIRHELCLWGPSYHPPRSHTHVPSILYVQSVRESSERVHKAFTPFPSLVSLHPHLTFLTSHGEWTEEGTTDGGMSRAVRGRVTWMGARRQWNDPSMNDRKRSERCERWTVARCGSGWSQGREWIRRSTSVPPFPTHSPVVAPSDTRKEWATAYGECGWVRSVGGFPRARHEKNGSFHNILVSSFLLFLSCLERGQSPIAHSLCHSC